jgi:hypothetical protein
MSKVLIGYIILVLCSFWAISAASSYGLRCGTALVSVGDSTAEVIAKCGEPEEAEVVLGVFDTIERWTYNFGSTKFIRYLRFVNDRLTAIRTGQYGNSFQSKTGSYQ